MMTTHLSHRRNKYSASLKSPRTATSLRGIFTDPKIKLEVSPDRNCVLNFSFLDSRPQMQRAFLELFHLQGESVVPKTKQNHLRFVKNFVMFLDDYEEKNGFSCRETSEIDGELLLNFKFWLETRPVLDSVKRRGARDNGGSDSLASLTVDFVYSGFVLLLGRIRTYRPELSRTEKVL